MKVLLKNTANVLKFVGYWPLETKNTKILFIYKTYFYLIMTIYILVILSVWLGVPNAAQSGLKKLVDNLAIGAQNTNAVIRMLCFSLPLMKRLSQQATATKKNILHSKGDSVKDIYIGHIKINRKLNNIILAACLVNVFAFILTPLVMKMSGFNDDEPLELVLPLYLPFNYHENVKIAFFFSAIGIIINGIYIANSNMLYAGWMIFIISQLAILKQDIVEGMDTKSNSDEEIYRNLRHFAMRYRKVSKFLNDFNKVVKFLNLLYFLLCIGHTSMVGFEVIADSFSFQLLKNILYLATSVTVELFMWYWFGNKIISEHSAIVKAIWESDWYNFNIKNKKAILIIMMQVQKPLTLSVGYSYSMSLETMTKILKTSMSYTIALKQFYASKK